MLFAGLDTHKESVQVHIVNQKTQSVREERFGTDDLGLENLGYAVRNAECVLEAGSTCYSVYDFLVKRGIKVTVADPRLVRSLSGLKKTDKVDAKRLALMLKAGIIPQAHIPTHEVRLDRDLVRQHIALTKQKTREINRLKALLLRYRIKPGTKNLYGKRANWLETIQVPQELRLVLEQHIESIRLLVAQRKKVDTQIETKAGGNKDGARLVSIPGVGWFTAHVVIAVVDGIHRFPSIEQLVSYAGLAPRVYQSGETHYSGKISKTGRAELRWALIQAAWSSVRHSKRFRKKYLKLKRKHGKKKAIVAVARKLLATMYSMLKNKTSFKECV